MSSFNAAVINAAAVGCRRHARQGSSILVRPHLFVIRRFIIIIVIMMTALTTVSSFRMIHTISTRHHHHHLYHPNSMTTTTTIPLSSFSQSLLVRNNNNNKKPSSCYRLGQHGRLLQLSLSQQEQGEDDDDDETSNSTKTPKASPPKKLTEKEKEDLLKYLDKLQEVQQYYYLPPAPDIMTLKPHQRLVAIGDVHGDVYQLSRSLEMARLVEYYSPPTFLGEDKKLDLWRAKWIGGNAICVFCGDVLDRGAQELACFRLICTLANQAKLAGGVVTMLWGNHEALNTYGYFGYAYKLTSDKDKDDIDYEDIDEFEVEFGRVLDEWHEYQATATTESADASSWRDSYDTPSTACPVTSPNPPFSGSWQYRTPPNQDAARWTAFEPGGLLAKPLLGNLKVAVIVGKTVLVHGGLALEHLELARTLAAKEQEDTNKNEVNVTNSTPKTLDVPPLDKTEKVPAPWGWDAIATMNRIVRDWVRSSPMASAPPPSSSEDDEWYRYKIIRDSMPPFLQGRVGIKESPVWFRDYSDPSDSVPSYPENTKTSLENVLTSLNVDRMVVGHTIQRFGINAPFEGKVWRVDVGMSRGCLTGDPEVLEVTLNEQGQEEVRVIALKKMVSFDTTTKTYLVSSLPARARYI